MSKRDISYLIDSRDIMAINADTNKITPTGDSLIGFNKYAVPDRVTESDEDLAIRVAEELFTERLDFYEGQNAELDYDDETGDPIEILDTDYEKMSVNYCVSIFNQSKGKIFKINVEYRGQGIPDDYEDVKIDKILDMFTLYRDLLTLRKGKKTLQDFYYKNYSYRICSVYL